MKISRYLRYRLAWFWADIWKSPSTDLWRAGNHPSTRRWKFK